MTEEPKFQAPPVPPKAPAFGVPPPSFSTSAPKEEVKATSETFFKKILKGFRLPPRICETKFMIPILIGCVAIGVAIGALLFGGGKAPQKTPSKGLLGVVNNPDIRERNLLRCGVPANSSACVVYIVNHARNDRYAEEFFAEAARLTGRTDYLVRIENQHYAKHRIGPGQIVRIKIPPLR